MATLTRLMKALAALEAALERADATGDFDAAEAVCRESRDAWFAYHEQWLTDPLICTPFGERLTTSLAHALESVDRIARAADPAAAESELLAKYVHSIQRRQDLLQTLHAADDPRAGARNVYRRIVEAAGPKST